MTPKAVVFDLGKVLVDFNYQLVADRLSARSGRKYTLQDLLENAPLLYKLESGQITNEEFFAAVVKKSGYSGTFDQFKVEFGDIFTEIPEMTAFNAVLQANSIPTFVFSNTNGFAVDSIRRTFPFIKNFTAYIYSFEHKVMKPQSKIYEIVEKVSGFRGWDILYIDDRPENATEGAAHGWQTVVHRNPKQTLTIARDLGLPVA